MKQLFKYTLLRWKAFNLIHLGDAQIIIMIVQFEM